MLLLSPDRIAERRNAARGPLGALAASLASDLAPLLMDGFELPREKALLSRLGGRCPDDATLLEFDPFSPRRHRCPRCARVYDDDAHYRWWIMSYQLWLAERAVHGALLALVRRDAEAGKLAESILDAYADVYLAYPNSDNVLGPTRLFFSTYLESIWLLQICIAIDLLEAAGAQPARGGRVRERIIEPASALIRSYDEGASNRQVWNNAALLASTTLLGSYPDSEAIVWGPSGVVSHLARGMLSDGTWYEGENYHLFAHRGLWYGVQMAERLELGLTESFVTPFVARFDAGFAGSFASALPDLTLPSRRDSQYAISVRQWRFAELCELGLLRSDDPRLRGLLAALYDSDIPRGDTGRARSTADVERNLPPSGLARSDLGWRSLLLARAELPALQREPVRSVLLGGQGLAVLRRAGGEAYMALDYGHSGGGHGHPDRLNVQLAHGTVRWLDDMGTGSYVDPTLHWYRSTLAHNAPLFDGVSQARVHGTLRAFEDDGSAGWVDAEASGLAAGVHARRSLVAMEGYLIDIFEWRGHDRTQVDLPIHLDADAGGSAEWTPAAMPGGNGLEDGFRFLRDAAMTHGLPGSGIVLTAQRGARTLTAWTDVSCDHEWWRATAPAAPGKGDARLYVMRARAVEGSVRTVFDWSECITNVRFAPGMVIVECRDGSTHQHSRDGDRWHIDLDRDGQARTRDLGGVQPPAAGLRELPQTPERRSGRRRVLPSVATSDASGEHEALVLTMGEDHYRRSELAWADAGRPVARVRLSASGTVLHIAVDVRKDAPLAFAPPRSENHLDNEHPDINSDGIQIHLADAAPDSTAQTWLLVPIVGRADVRVRAPDAAPDLDATWAVAPGGYIVRCSIALPPRMAREGFDLDVIVNEIAPGRERRRGQLVLSGGRGEWIFLRGDRQSRDRLLPFAIGTRESRS